MSFFFYPWLTHVVIAYQKENNYLPYPYHGYHNEMRRNITFSACFSSWGVMEKQNNSLHRELQNAGEQFMVQFSKCPSQFVAFSLIHYKKGETKRVKNLVLLETSGQTFLGSNSKYSSLAELLHFCLTLIKGKIQTQLTL